jgi:hypothetical protein
MIKTKELNTLEDFTTLKKGDVVAVEWKRDSYKNKKRTRFATYEVVDNLANQTEIILQKAMNVYFNYSMFLKPSEHGASNVRSIALITIEAL